jgi:8-oxo-dGTP diphosphatase
VPAGGGVEPGETWADAAMRECVEETGWSVRLTGLLGVYSDPSTQSHVYPGGRSVLFVGVAFLGEVLDRLQDPGDESSEVAFFEEDELPEPLFPPDPPLLEDFVRRTLSPFLR